MESAPLFTGEIGLTLAVLAAVVYLFLSERLRVDVVAILMMVTLPLLGLVTPGEAFSGLSSNAVVSIIAVIIIGAGLDRTGVMNKVAAPIVRFGNGKASRLGGAVSGTVGLISSFMQNIGAAALFLPATMRVSKQTGVPLSRLLMPMGFCAILGGTVTMVGSSPLIILNDLMKNAGLEEFGLFSVTPIGLALLGSGILYFVVLGHFLLPDRYGENHGASGGVIKLLSRYQTAAQTFELAVPESWSDSGKTLEELGMRRLFLVTVVAIKPTGSDTITLSPSRTHRLNGGDRFAVVGHENNVRKLVGQYGFFLKKGIETFEEELSDNNAGLVEGIIPPRSELVGSTLRKERFVHRWGISPMALYREGKIFRAGHSDIPLKTGDALLLHGSWRSFADLKKSPSILLPVDAVQEPFQYGKAKKALFAFGLALLLVAAKDLFGLPISLSVCLMTGALAMVLGGVVTIDDAYEAVDWRTVFLLGGLIPLGIATEKTGTAEWLAHQTLDAMGTVSPLLLLTVIALLATLFSLVISNVGATVLLVPLAIEMAQGVGADPRIAALVVGLATSNSFLLPTHQVNALLMGPGGYRTTDYLRAGSGMTLLFLVVMIATLWAFYGVEGG